MNGLGNKTEKETKEIIKNLRQKIKFDNAYDSVSFIKLIQPNSLMFHIKAKNNCGYKSCDIDEDIIVKL